MDISAMEKSYKHLTREELEAMLREQEHIVEMFSTAVLGGIAKISLEDMSIIEATEGYYRMTGYTKKESLLPPFSNCGMNIVLPQDIGHIQSAIEKLLRENQPVCADYRIRKKDGSIVWNTAYCTEVEETAQGKNITAFFIDTTQEKEKEKQNFLNEERFRIISEQTKDVIFDWNIDEDEVHYSPVYEKMFGTQPPSSVSTKDLLTGEMIYEEDKPIIAKMIEDTRSGVPYIECTARLRAADGTYFWAKHRVTTITGVDGSASKHVVGIISDIDDIMKNTLDLQHKAAHDQLTGLLYRTEAKTLIEQVLKKHEDQKHAFIEFDIDLFKQINDFLGHAAGDFALQKIASQMRELFRKEDILVRMGGDEFSVFLVNPGSRDNVAKKAKQFRQAVSCDLKFEEKIYPLSVSIGIAMYPEDGQTFQKLYEHADRALYQAKHSGGNKCEFFSKSSKPSKKTEF